MKIDQALLKDLIFFIEKNDCESGVEFAEHAYIEKSRLPAEVRTGLLQARNLDDTTRYQCWIRLSGTGASEIVHLEPMGHEMAATFRANTWPKKVARLLAGWMDRAMTAIFLPILVSGLTVVLLNYLGLNK